jgi:serine/threonine-protein kinase
MGDAEFCGLDGERVIDSPIDPLIGAVIDRYTLHERLGQGGMACVYRATHEKLERDYAIKLLYGDMSSDKQFAERFKREAQTAAQLDHPNVVKVVDFGVTPEGLNFLVMELLNGHTLHRILRDKGPLSPRRAAGFLKQIAAGLAVAHKAGFVHRDLKPGNIMIVEERRKQIAKILDFGLVRLAGESDRGSNADRLTRTGVTLGTPYYMAPEQIRGEQATPKSDLYGLGAVLYEMLSGAPPYKGSLPEIIVQQFVERPRPLGNAGGLERLAEELLSKDPGDRPESANDLIERIEKLGRLSDKPVPPGELETAIDRNPKPLKRADSTRMDRAQSRARSQIRRPPRRRFSSGLGLIVLAVFAGAMVFIAKRPTRVKAIESVVMGPAKAVARELKDDLSTLRPPDKPAEKPVERFDTPSDQDLGSRVGKAAPPLDPSRSGPDLGSRVGKAAPPLDTTPPIPPPSGPAPVVTAPVTPPSNAPAHETHPDNKPKPKLVPIAQLETTLDRALLRRGLSMGDLYSQKTGAPLAQRWDRAKRANNLEEANNVAPQIQAEIPKVKIDSHLVRAKLVRLNGAIARARRTLPAKRLQPIDDQMKTLRTKIEKKNPTDAECRVLVVRVTALEIQLAGAMKSVGVRG